MLYDAEIVRDEEEGKPEFPLQILEKLKDLRTDRKVKRTHRLVANEQLREGLATVRILDCNETWYGMTYREDLDSVKAAIADMKMHGIYPERLWD